MTESTQPHTHAPQVIVDCTRGAHPRRVSYASLVCAGCGAVWIAKVETKQLIDGIENLADEIASKAGLRDHTTRRDFWDLL